MKELIAQTELAHSRTAPEIIPAYKYMLTDTGIIFILLASSLPNPPRDEEIKMVKGQQGTILLRLGNIHGVLTGEMIEHLAQVMSNSQTVRIIFAESQPDDYEIKPVFASELDQVGCATVVSLYRIAKKGGI